MFYIQSTITVINIRANPKQSTHTSVQKFVLTLYKLYTEGTVIHFEITLLKAKFHPIHEFAKWLRLRGLHSHYHSIDQTPEVYRVYFLSLIQ